MLINRLPAYGTTQIKKAGVPGWLLAFAFLGTAAFLVLRYTPWVFPTSEPPSRRTPEGSAVQLRTTDAVELMGHLDRAIANANDALAAVRRSGDWTERGFASLDDPALTARRIEIAHAASQSAATKIERAREELEISKDICERSTTQ